MVLYAGRLTRHHVWRSASSHIRVSLLGAAAGPEAPDQGRASETESAVPARAQPQQLKVMFRCICEHMKLACYKMRTKACFAPRNKREG